MIARLLLIAIICLGFPVIAFAFTKLSAWEAFSVWWSAFGLSCIFLIINRG